MCLTGTERKNVLLLSQREEGWSGFGIRREGQIGKI